MKKLLFFLFLLFSGHPVFAQTDFLELVNSIDWNATETDMVAMPGVTVQMRKHSYNSLDKTTTDYQIAGITLGNRECRASIFVDSISRKIHSLHFSFGEIDRQVDAAQFSKEMDNILYPLFGDPDQVKNDWDNPYIKDARRVWYKDSYIVDSHQMIFPKSYLYSLIVKGIPPKENDFRVAKWGESKSSVMKKENKADQAGIDKLYLFNDYVAGRECEVAYIFTDDQLSMAKYIFHPSHTNKNDFINDYEELVNLLTQKYGSPRYNAPEWHNSLYQKDYDQYGFAVSLGHLSYSAGWFGDLTDVTVALFGENYKISLIIQYTSNKYKEKKERNDIQTKIKDL